MQSFSSLLAFVSLIAGQFVAVIVVKKCMLIRNLQ